jgi:hypothetical protein
MTDATATLVPVVEQLIGQYLPADKIATATDWLSKFESGCGQMNIAAILIHAEQNALFGEAVTALEKCWEADFQYTHPEARANDAIPKTDFLLNRIMADAKLLELETINGKIAELMTSEYTIKTHNSSYHLSSKPVDGFRTLTREGDGKETIGNLISIKLDWDMSFEIDEGESAGKYWNTSVVTEIIPL